VKRTVKLMTIVIAAALSVEAPAQQRAILAPVAKNYLKEAIAAFQKYHINRSKVDWTVLTNKAYSAVNGAQKTSDTYPAIELIIRELGEKHTKFLDPERTKAIMSGKAAGQSAAPVFTLPEGYLLAGKVGAIRLYTLMGSREQANLYVVTGRKLLLGLRQQGACGYMVDLRSDGGGNMWPMLNTLTGLFDDGVLGRFEMADGRKENWVRRNGAIDTEAATATAKPSPSSAVVPVAVLIGPQTASAGEFTAMALAGRSKTRFFGAPTSGYVTANAPIPMSDGAMIAMTTGWGLDRTGKRYEDAIIPDEPAAQGGPTVDAALQWLKAQGCGAHRAPQSSVLTRQGGKRRASPAL
jgi:carboxyl-terminal processing protease